MSTAIPDWMYPPRDSGWEADDLDQLPPDAPRHIELLDGALIFNMSPQRSWHHRIIRRLTAVLEKAAPQGWTVEAQMTVKLNQRSRPEPDIVVSRVPYAPERIRFLPAEVGLVIEIESTESQDRDRRYKPRLYEAGLRHFWRIEDEAGLPVVHIYELDDTTGVYVASGVFRDRIVVTVPLAVDVPLADLTR